MSLLITSNTPKNEVGDTVSGLNLPYSYQNNLQDTLRIPKNSEVAVQSVKVNRSGQMTLSSGDNMGLFFGEEIADDGSNNDINSFCVPTRILTYGDYFGDADEFYTGSPQNIAEKIQYAGNLCLQHPNFCKNASSDINTGFTCDVLRNASNTDFLGFQYILTNSDDTQNETVNIPTEWLDIDNTTSWGYNAGTRVLTNNTGVDFASCVGTDFPLSQASGVFSCSILHNDENQEFGLTRCISNLDVADGYPFVPEYFDDDGDGFYDWQVEILNTNVISVYHAVPSADPSVMSLVEFNYLANASSGGNKFNASNDEIDRVDFTVKGERMKISLFKGATEYVLCDGTKTVSASNVKPTNMNTRFLYPKVRLNTEQTVGINVYNGVNVVGGDGEAMVYGNDSSSGELTESQLNIDWWVNHSEDDLADQMDLTYDKALNFTNQKGLNASGQIDYKPAIFCGKDNRYEFTSSLNSQRILGFPDRPLVFQETSVEVGAPYELTYNSDETPLFESTTSLFVRVKNMTFDSVNFSKSALSKILYHLPASTNSGESAGALYFEPTERVYLTLNNPTDLFISTIDIDIVNADETIADDLTGKTTVILHIRDA